MNMMNATMTTLENVRRQVLENLSAYEVIGCDKDDLDQEIYRATLELMENVDSLEDLARQVLKRIKRSIKMVQRKPAASTDEIEDRETAIEAAVMAGYHARAMQYQRDMEQKRAKHIIEDLLENCLTLDKEVVVRLRFGIPTAEMVDTIGALPGRQYRISEIATMLGMGSSAYSGMVMVNDLLMHAMQMLRVNGRAFYMVH